MPRFGTAVLVMAALLCAPGPVSAGVSDPSPQSAPGTRVVPVVRQKQKAAGLGKAAPAPAPAQAVKNPGSASVSKYVTPEFDRTSGSEAALTWVFGVLGGDRERIGSAPALFSEAAPAERATAYIILREQLYPLSTWTVGGGRLLGVEKDGRGYRVRFSAPDASKLIEESMKKVSAKWPGLSKEAQRVLAEWRAAGRLRSPEGLAALEAAEQERLAPVNSYGRLCLGPGEAGELLSTPERLLVEISGEFSGGGTPEWAAPYMDAAGFIVKYSAGASFSDELKAALGAR